MHFYIFTTSKYLIIKKQENFSLYNRLKSSYFLTKKPPKQILNNKSMEEISSASQNLAEMAEELQAMTSKFKV